MSGIGSTLQVAKAALMAQSYGLNVTGNNIANVNNPEYSRQLVEFQSAAPRSYYGVVIGDGVTVQEVRQSVDQLLEDRLTDEKSSLSASEEAESYMQILEGFFDENSETSITALMSEFWNSWQDLADNPQGPAERVAVLENAEKLASRFNLADNYFDSLDSDITREMEAGISRINDITAQIAVLNQEIVRSETRSRANDLRDQRNGLIDELGDLVDINAYEQPNGTMIISVTSGLDIVHGVDSTDLVMRSDDIFWYGANGVNVDITQDITGGKLGGWLTIRDEVVPKYASEIDELAHELIWSLNYQHSQGAGLEYFTEDVTGHYSASDSELLSTFEYGEKIDYSGDVTLWMQDSSGVESVYSKVDIDMGISQATLSDWQGTAPGGDELVYKLTVVDPAVIGDFQVSETDGSGLGMAVGSWGAGDDVSTALNNAIMDQKITVSGSPDGTQVIDVNDTDGEAARSAASIAEQLSGITGVTAYASETTATFDLSGMTTPPQDTHDGDEVQYSLYVDGRIYDRSFVVDSNQGTILDQFEADLVAAARAINDVASNDDLTVVSDTLLSQVTLTSKSGSTLGVQEFEVVDNAGVKLDGFTGFADGDALTFVVETNGAFPGVTTVDVDLTGVGTPPDPVLVAKAFNDALSSALVSEPVSVTYDETSNSVMLRTTDGSDIILRDADGAPGASFTMTAQAGTTLAAGDATLDFDGSGDTATFDSDTQNTDYIDFSGMGSPFVRVYETTGVGNKAAVVAGTVTLLLEPDMAVHSNATGPGSIFENSNATIGSSIMTFGGEGGYSGFSVGNIISFEVDGIPVSYTVGAADDTEVEYAMGLEASLAVLPAADYQVFRTGTSVSIIKNQALDDPIEITAFTATTAATLSVSTGTGTGTNAPVNDRLDSADSDRQAATSTLYDDQGIIYWEKYDVNGYSTGEYGFVTVEDQGRVTLIEEGTETLSFEISTGSLVAGNTLSVNTSAQGIADPLDFTIKGSANNILDVYEFTVVSGGKVGHLPETGEEPITIEWKTGDSYGSFTIPGTDPPVTPASPIEVPVDGMLLKFYDGTLFKGDTFTITTDASGLPVSETPDGDATGEKASDWHWTLDSFADQFNRQTPGMKATVTVDHRLTLSRSDSYFAVENKEYSGSEGFDEVNADVVVNDWTAFDFPASDLRFVRSSGGWGIQNDPTGGKMVLIPEGGDDDGFGVDVTADGIADFEIRFKNRVTGDGFIEFDFVRKDPEDLSFAFSNEGAADSGLMAVMGINTFYKGFDASSMTLNDALHDVKNIAAASIDAETGTISEGDNANAMAMAGLQDKDVAMKQWDFSRGEEADSSLIGTTLDGYLRAMIGSMGIESKSIKNARSFSEALVNQLQEQRDAVSAVSLDEEMIHLIEFQHAFTAASKLISVSDEMLNTLVGMR